MRTVTSYYYYSVFYSALRCFNFIKIVKPFVRGDHNDALVIAETAKRPGIKPVPIKTIEQQDIQSLHRLRECCASQRMALSNPTWGLLSECGIIFVPGFKTFKQMLAFLLDTKDTRVSPLIKQELQYISEEVDCMTLRLKALNHSLSKLHTRHRLYDCHSTLQCYW